MVWMNIWSRIGILWIRTERVARHSGERGSNPSVLAASLGVGIFHVAAALADDPISVHFLIAIVRQSPGQILRNRRPSHLPTTIKTIPAWNE